MLMITERRALKENRNTGMEEILSAFPPNCLGFISGNMKHDVPKSLEASDMCIPCLLSDDVL